MREGYDVMQACLNGHQITDSAGTSPEFRKLFCAECGAKTIMACTECDEPIQGFYYVSGMISLQKTPVPNNCHQCGTAYPWRQAEIANAIEVLQMELDDSDAAGIPELSMPWPLTFPGLS
jgi:hypothetical protein